MKQMNHRRCCMTYKVRKVFNILIQGHTKGYSGTMHPLLTAPNDPAFLIHHSMVDKLLEVWFYKRKTVPVHQVIGITLVSRARTLLEWNIYYN